MQLALRMELFKVKISVLEQKAQMFEYKADGALKNTLRNTMG